MTVYQGMGRIKNTSSNGAGARALAPRSICSPMLNGGAAGCVLPERAQLATGAGRQFVTRRYQRQRMDSGAARRARPNEDRRQMGALALAVLSIGVTAVWWVTGGNRQSTSTI